MHNVLGQFERGVEEAKEAVRRNPSHGFPYSNLAHSYRGLGDFDQAKKTAERAVLLNIETLPTRRLLYQLAVIAGDAAAATQHLEWARDKPREFEIMAARAQVAGCSGKLREARELYAETARMAELRNLFDVGTNHLAFANWTEMAYGNTDQALQGARRILERSPNYDPCLRVALTLSACGCEDEAEAIVENLAAKHPEHTIINSILVPIARAGIALARKDPIEAVQQLETVRPFELGFSAVLAPIYLRAQACLMQGAGVEAAKEFQRIGDRRGSEPFSPFYAVAPFGLARAYVIAGNKVSALEAYKQFLSSWANADSDVPVLVQAREEYASIVG